MTPMDLPKPEQAFLEALKAGNTAAEAAAIAGTKDRPMYLRDACAYLGMTRRSLERLIADGVIATCTIPGLVCSASAHAIMLSEILGYLAKGAGL